MTNRVVITHAKRTPIGRFLGAFTEVSAVELGVTAVKVILSESGIDPATVGEVIFGNARQAGNRPNPARQIGCFSGLPDTVPAYTVNKACGSSLKAIILAYQALALGDSEIIIAGGAENMTRTPFMFDKMRWGYRLGNAPLIDGMYHDGFLCPMSNLTMGETAEKLNQTYKIPREEQDKFALRSHQLAVTAAEKGLFKDEIAPVAIKGKKGETVTIDRDEGPRAETNLEKLSKLPLQFGKDGTVTAGNSCQISDGASAVLVMTEERARKLGFEPLAFVGNYSVVAIDPSIMGIAPVPAVKELLKKTGKKLEEFDLMEINEAFAAQVLACDRELHFNWDVTNVSGGAIALGHPIGATGARFVTTLLHGMKRRGAKNGLATLCHSGGMGIAVQFYRE